MALQNGEGMNTARAGSSQRSVRFGSFRNPPNLAYLTLDGPNPG